MNPDARPPESLILRNVRVPGGEALHDVALAQGRIASFDPAGEGARPAAGAGVESLDADGRFLIPGLWDHHVHFTQWVIARRRLDLAATTSAAEVLQLVRGAIAADPALTAGAATAGSGVVGYGFRDGLWPDLPSLSSLDEATGSVPVGLISGDLHCIWLNSAQQSRLGVSTDASGLLREADSFAVMDQLQDPAALTPEVYRQTAAAAARRGVVGIVEFENADNISQWPLRTAAGVDSLRVEVSVWPDRLQSAVDAGISTGDVLDDRGLVTMGPLKVISDGSLNTRTAWCWDPYPEVDLMHPHSCGMQTVPMDELQDVMRQARDAGISAAIHAIGDRANSAVLDAFEALAMPGVIEHAQLLRWEDIPRFARLGLTASVQPEHAMDDRDVADAYWAGRTDRAFPLDALTRAGVRLRLGSDAPVAPLDPWVAIAAAVSRSRDGRDPWHPEQRLDPATALAAACRGGTASGGHQLGQGSAADLVLVETDPLAPAGPLGSTDPLAQTGLRDMGVSATLLGGRLTYDGIR